MKRGAYLLLALCWLPRIGAAASPEETARARQLTAFGLFAEGAYVKGIEEMERAYRAQALPKFVLNIAVAYTKMSADRCPDAIATFNRYLTLCAAGRPCPNREAALQRRAAAAERCGIPLAPVAPPPPVASPIDEPPPASPVAAEAIPSPEPPWGLDTWGWIALGAGGAAGAIGTVYGLIYLASVDEAERLEASARGTGADRATAREVLVARDQAETDGMIATAAWGLAGASLLAGGLLLGLASDAPEAQIWAPVIAPGQIGLTGRF